MESFLIYIGKASLAAGTFYLLYLALFQHQKQFVFNRIYLPVSLALSFLIPLITFTSVNYIEASQTFNPNSFAFLPEASETAPPEFMYQWYHYLFGIYVLGVIGFLFNLLLGHIKAFSVIRYSRLKELFGARVNLTKKDVHPFSFFNKIVLSENTLDNPNLEIIVSHEKIHVNEKHTLDILFAETLFLFQWFNPFAWLLKDAMRNNLEYKTDDQIAQKNDAEAYQLAMVGLAHKDGVAPFLTALNGSQLKNRIIMMKKGTENKYALLKQLLVLPLLAILVMGLSTKEVKTEIVQAEKEVKIVLDGKVIPADHLGLKAIDFNKSIDSGDIIDALDINNVIVNSLNIENENLVFYIRTSEYIPGSNQEFEKQTTENIVLDGNRLTEDYHYAIDNKIVSKQEFDEIGKVGFENVVFLSGEDATNKYGEKFTGVIADATSGVANFSVTPKKSTEKYDTKANRIINAPTKKEEATKNKIHSYNFEINGSEYKTSDTNISNEKKTTLKGTVTNQVGEAIASAAILIEGTTTATISDISGNFEITLEKLEKPTVLIFSALNYHTNKVIYYGKKKKLDVVLTPDKETNLNGVKVIGYGKQKDSSVKEIIQIKATGNGEGNQPLYILDGKQVKSIDKLQADDIESISVLKDASPTFLYGEKGKNGVVLITSKNAANVKNKKEVKVIGYGKQKHGSSAEEVKVEITGDTKNPPLYVVDGKTIEDINAIDADDIESISVLKGKQATALYGTVGGKNGVVLITTKNKVDFGAKTPLVFIDGIKSDKDLNDLDPDNIKSVDILKNESATKLYGPAAKDGAILITTKLSGVDSQNVLPVVLNGELTSLTLNKIDRDLIKNIKKVEPGLALIKYGEKGKNGVFEVNSRKLYTEKVDVKSTDELEAEKAKSGTIVIKSKGTQKFDGKSPLIMVDGIKYPGDVNDINPESIKAITVLKDASAIEKYGAEGKDGVIVITTKSAEITTVLELRKFIAKTIKYPLKAQEQNDEGSCTLFVKVNDDGIIYSVSEKKLKNAVAIAEVMVVAYKTDSPVAIGYATKKEAEEAKNYFLDETRNVINQMPTLKIPSYKGKTLAITTKFVLQ